jgi:hypothetical protein
MPPTINTLNRLSLNRVKCSHSDREAEESASADSWHVANHSRFLTANGAVRNDKVIARSTPSGAERERLIPKLR